MAKVKVELDEFYPWPVLDYPHAEYEIDVSEEELASWRDDLERGAKAAREIAARCRATESDAL